MRRLENCNHCTVELTNEEMYLFDDKWYCSECLGSLSYVSTDNLSVEKLQEQLNTAKKALTEISEVKNLTPFKKGFETSKAVSKARDMRNTARQALAAIGGDDE